MPTLILQVLFFNGRSSGASRALFAAFEAPVTAHFDPSGASNARDSSSPRAAPTPPLAHQACSPGHPAPAHGMPSSRRSRSAPCCFPKMRFTWVHRTFTQAAKGSPRLRLLACAGAIDAYLRRLHALVASRNTSSRGVIAPSHQAAKEPPRLRLLALAGTVDAHLRRLHVPVTSETRHAKVHRAFTSGRERPAQVRLTGLRGHKNALPPKWEGTACARICEWLN